MTALTADRNTPAREGGMIDRPVAASTLIWAGALVCQSATGFAVPGSTATGLVVLGRAEERVDNSLGADGDLTIRIKRGVFRFVNSAAADEITGTEIGSPAWIVDDQTVAKTNGTNTRSLAGTVDDVDAQGVWVDTRRRLPAIGT